MVRTWFALGRTWFALGLHLVRTWFALGRTWFALDRTWFALGRTWFALGCTHVQVAAVNACELAPLGPWEAASGFRLMLAMPYEALG